ncbi:MAG: hypothetical protein ACE5G0_09625 [Rhodothermales bacterium]
MNLGYFPAHPRFDSILRSDAPDLSSQDDISPSFSYAIDYEVGP